MCCDTHVSMRISLIPICIHIYIHNIHSPQSPLNKFFIIPWLILSPITYSSQQNTSNRTQTTTEYKTSYQVTKQARNTVVDTRGGRRVEGGVFSVYYPGRSRAKIVNIDEEKQGGYVGREEPQVKVRDIRGPTKDAAQPDRVEVSLKPAPHYDASIINISANITGIKRIDFLCTVLNTTQHKHKHKNIKTLRSFPYAFVVA